MLPLKWPSLAALAALSLPHFACSATAGSADTIDESGDDQEVTTGESTASGNSGNSPKKTITLDDGSTGGASSGPDDVGGEDCDATIELIVRDFHATHPDFQAFDGGQGEVGCGMVENELNVSDGVRTPVFFNGSGSGKREIDANGIITCIPWDQYYTGPSEITSATTFADWYNNVEGVNHQIEYTLQLSAEGTNGNFVFDSAGSSGFFPVDNAGFNEITENHNYHFTTEAHIRFGYQAGQKFTFSGDDDLWIFVNGKLALDLGGMHSPITATIDFDAQAALLGITAGKTYNMDIFHAERHTSASNFRVETNISCFETVYVPVIR